MASRNCPCGVSSRIRAASNLGSSSGRKICRLCPVGRVNLTPRFVCSGDGSRCCSVPRTDLQACKRPSKPMGFQRKKRVGDLLSTRTIRAQVLPHVVLRTQNPVKLWMGRRTSRKCFGLDLFASYRRASVPIFACEKFGRTSAPRLPQAVQVKPGSISHSWVQIRPAVGALPLCGGCICGRGNRSAHGAHRFRAFRRM